MYLSHYIDLFCLCQSQNITEIMISVSSLNPYITGSRILLIRTTTLSRAALKSLFIYQSRNPLI